MTLVQILGTGVSGFTVVILGFGYRLLKTIVEQKSAADAASQKALAKKIRAVQVFLGVSVLFFVGGIIGIFFTRENELALIVVPDTIADDVAPSLFHRGERLQIVNGASGCRVKNGDTINIQFDRLVRKIGDLLHEQETQRRIAAALAARSSNSSEGGFSDAH